MERWWFSKCGSRLNAARIRSTCVQQLHGLRAVAFQNGSLALALRTVVLKFASASRIQGGSFSKCGSRFSAAHI
eukprot:1069444-Pyramimonas_sp.AAC.1